MNSEPTPILIRLARIFEPGARGWECLLITIASLTTLILWSNHGQLFDGDALQQIWQAREQPNTLYQYLLHPIARRGDQAVMLFSMVNISLILWLFARISQKIGIGRKSFFLLFVLLNFSPEFNDVRISADPYYVGIVFWLIAVWWFLHFYGKHLYIAFLGWAGFMWTAALFSWSFAFWALGLPLCFLFWPGAHRHWWQRIGERGKFIFFYYLLIALIIFVVPVLRQKLFELVRLVEQQFYVSTLDMSIFINADSGFDLGLLDAFLIAMVLVAMNVLKIASVLIVFLMWLAWRPQAQSVLSSRVILFFTFSLGFAWLLHGLSFLYLNRFQPDQHYLTVLMLILWLSAGGASYCVQHLRSGHIRPQHMLVGAWIMVAYALASMLQFGPSSVYKREAGQWVSEQPVAAIYSNSPVAMYYAGQSPLASNTNIIPFDELSWLGTSFGAQDRFIFVLGRKSKRPEALDHYEIVAQFANRNGDTAYILAPKEEIPGA